MNRAAFALLLFCASPAWADEADDMKAAATAFYSLSTGPRSAGVPDQAALTRYAPLLSASLTQALTRAGAAQARWSARNRIAPQLLEGDVFSSLFEGATGFTVEACLANGVTGECRVALVRDDGNTVQWTDRLILAHETGGWRVDNIAYGAPWSFANTGTLRDTLQMAIGLSGQ